MAPGNDFSKVTEITDFTYNPTTVFQTAVCMRDKFAMAALTVISSISPPTNTHDTWRKEPDRESEILRNVELAYEYADIMIKVRGRGIQEE